jgi:hypothetical protein
MASTFRTIVAKNATSKLCEGISLESGPGPTTIRALAPDQTAYFSTVIQCSFLTAVLKRSSLASALKNFFDKQAQDAPAGHSLRASPSEDGISGFLQACEDQTSLYNWTHQLCAVAAVLGYAEPDQAAEGILPTILHGLLSTLPLSQHFPEEYIIQIESGTGECWIVVWAHYILGLSILVKTWNNGVCTEVPFGLGPAQIIIDARSVVSYKIREPSLTLLRRADETGNEPLFSFKPDPDESKIESIYRVPAKGYGKIALLSVISNFDGISATATEAIVRDMTSVTCALVLLVSNSLGAGSPTYPASGQSDEELSDEEYDGSLEDLDINSSPDECDIGSQHELSDGAGHLVIEKRRLLEAAQFIFNRQQINYATVSQYTELYTSKPLTRKLEPPRSVKAAFKEDIFQESYWARLVDTARYLSILIIAFAHVRDLNACDDLMLHHQIAILIDIPLAKNLRTWDGISLLDIVEF